MNRIYVACLASYNAGKLHGCWIDADGKSSCKIHEEIQNMLSKSDEPFAEEWAIHDTEGFEGLKISESHDIDELASYCEAMESCEYDINLITEVMSNFCFSVSEAISHCEDNYQGEYESLECWAEHFLDETGSLDKVPGELRAYIDCEAYGIGADLSGDIFTFSSPKGIYVLWNS